MLFLIRKEWSSILPWRYYRSEITFGTSWSYNIRFDKHVLNSFLKANKKQSALTRVAKSVSFKKDVFF